MDEAKKTSAVRNAYTRGVLAGHVIDIGCGPDLVVPHAIPFDQEHGDAQHILNYHPPESFDTVHSSHCLEHMRDPKAALFEWWSLVRRGGHLIVVVPEEDLYEQGAWPSLFNKDHKATFRLNRASTWSAHSYDIGELASGLPDAEVVSARIQDDGYDRGLMLTRINRWNRMLYRLERRRRRLLEALSRRGVGTASVDRYCDQLERRFGKPVDQTYRGALAQIEVVVRKRS
jgi:SAM-dependent methyltransferase